MITNGIKMSNIIIKPRFAIRLRRERERLGLTQQEFADKVGVNRMSQVNYESGKRYPGEEYFENLKNIEGIDEFYLAFGMHTEGISTLVLGAQSLFQAIAQSLELECDSFSEAWEEATRCAAINVDEDSTNSSKLLTETVDRYVAGILGDSPVILNENDLIGILQNVEEAISRNKAHISPAKKARIVSMLYGQHRILGSVGDRMIDDAIALATEE